MTEQALGQSGLGAPFAASGAVQGGSLSDMGDAPQPLLPGSPDAGQRLTPVHPPAKPIDESDPTSVYTGMPNKAIMALRANPTPELRADFNRKYDRRHKKEGDDKPNYFDQYDNEPDAGDPGLTERMRLNAIEAQYRSSLGGSARLQALAENATSPVPMEPAALQGSGLIPADIFRSMGDPKELNKLYKSQYESIVADLIKFESMKGFDSTLEAAAALGGQVFGSVLSVETALNWPIAGASLPARMISGGIQGAIVNTVTDPFVQANAMRAKVQEEFSPERVVMAPVAGFAGGALLTGGVELALRGALKAGTAMSQPFRRKTIIEVGKDDPSIRRPDIKEDPVAPPAAPAPETPKVPPAQMTDEQLRVSFERAQAGIHKDDDVVPEAVRRFGVPVEKETTFYRAEQPGRPDLTDATSTPVTDRIGAEDYAFNRNKDTLENVGKGQGGELVLSEIVVPPGTPLLTSREVSGAVPNHEAILPPGRFVKVGERTEQFQFGANNAIGYHRIKTYRFEPLAENTAMRSRASDLTSIEKMTFDEFRSAAKTGIIGPAEPLIQHALGISFEKVKRPSVLVREDDLGHIDRGINYGYRDEDIVRFLTQQEERGNKFANWLADAQGGQKIGPQPEVSDGAINRAYEKLHANDVVLKSDDPLALRPLPRADGGAEQALAVRRGGSGLNMEARRPAAGVPQQTGTSVATTAQPVPAKDTAILSTQQQARALADALDIPLFQGRNKAGTLATYNTKTGVVRASEIADLQVVAHEVGHAIEAKVGSELTTITNTHAYELSALDYDPARGSVAEGFAEWARLYVTSQNYAQNMAPGFTTEFTDFMTRQHPQIMDALNTARASALAYYNAPSVDAVSAVRRSQSDNPAGLAKVVDNVKNDGFAGTVKMVAQKLYETFLDDKSPFTRAVRDLGRRIKEREGGLIDLKDADNPAVMLRLLDRAHQAAVRDTMDGVRGYHAIAPEGPSLADAMAKATGDATIWGKWDSDKVATFADYLIARRGYEQWKKFERGEIPNPPVPFSRADAMVAMADLERANPTFREASDMVHAWTRQLLKKMKDGHLIDADIYNKLMKEEFYVPLMRDLSDRPLSGGAAAGRGGQYQNAPEVVKRFRGSSRDIISPLESLMTQSFLVNRTLRHNDVILAFETMAERAGPEGGKFFEQIKPTEMKKRNFDLRETVERLAHERGLDPDDIKLLSSSLTDMFGDDPIVGSFFHAEAAKGRGEPIVFYKRNGETRAARIMAKGDGEPLYEILTSLPKPLTDMYSLLIGTTSGILRSGVTTNPMFALTNYMRDQLAIGLIRSDYIPFVSGAKGLVDEVLQRQNAVLYGYGGGVSAGVSVAQYEAAIKNDINALAKKGYLVNRLTSVKGALELASVTEAASRNSVFGKVFEAKKAQGLSDYEALIEAAFAAQDILDFSRHGSRTEAMRRYVPFLNAWFQGMDKAGRTVVLPIIQKLRNDQVFASDPVQFRNAVLSATKILGVGSVLGAMWAALHADSEKYRDASPLLKGTHVVMPVGRNIVLIPKPFELGIGFTAGEYAYQMMMQSDPRSAAQFAEAAWDSMTGANPLYDIPLLKTAYELKLGKSVFTGRDIVPGELQRLKPEEQYTDKTSSLAKMLGQQIGVSPIKIDYTIGSMFGLWGRDVMALSSGVDPNAPDRSWEDMALVRRLLKDPDRTSNITTKFWEYMGQTTGKYNQDVATYENFLKSGRADRDQLAKEFMSRLPSDERAFVILKSAANDNGKPAFKANEKKMHPLQRAYDAVTILNQMRKELNDNTFRDFEEGQNTNLDPTTRRYLIENVRELAQTELRNALVIIKEPGYTGRQLFDLDVTMDKIKALSPVVYEEIRTRYATGKIPRTQDVAMAYQKMKADLLRNGSDADPGDYVTGDYEFDGDRVKKPQKRRIEIAPSPAIQ